MLRSFKLDIFVTFSYTSILLDYTHGYNLHQANITSKLPYVCG